MTHVDRYTARQARIQRIFHGVVASYIYDIAPAGDRALEASASRHDGGDARPPARERDRRRYRGSH